MKVNPLLVGIVGIIIGYVIAYLSISKNENCSIDISLTTVDSTHAQTYFNHYWEFSEGAIPKRPNKIEQILNELDSTKRFELDAFHKDVNGFYKDEYRLTNLTLDLNMLQQINEAYKKLGEPKYLKLFMGDVKPKTPQFGFIAVGFDTTRVNHMGVAPPAEDRSDGYTEEMYYLEGDVSPTCPYECDREWPIEKPPHYPH